MRELHLLGPEKMVLREVEGGALPHGNQVKIRVLYGGICGSDIKVYKGMLSYAAYPLRPGHEVLGVVTAQGENSKIPIGTRVVAFPNTFCDTCEFCAKGQTNICENKKPLGVSTDGVFAEEILLEEKYAVPVVEGLKDERAILVEPFAVVVHAFQKVEIMEKTNVAIIGAGTEGLLSIALALYQKGTVTMIDINPKKFELAKQFGEIEVLRPEEIGERKFDVVIEAAGTRSALMQGLDIVKPGGTVVALGITSDPVELLPIHLVRSEISLLGSIIYTKEDFFQGMEYLKDPNLHVEPVISRIVPLAEFAQAYEAAASGNYGKIILKF